MENLDKKTLKLKGDLTLVAVEDQAALLDVEKRCYYDPNDTAFFLLTLMEDGCGYEHMKAELVSKFDTGPETTLHDVDSFVDELLKLGLVEVTEEATASGALPVSKEGRRAYQAPQLENKSVIAVSGANGVTTPDA